MPEGHTIHRIARDQTPRFCDQRLRVSSPQGRFADGAAELNGRILREIEAHGKHLFYHWSGRRILHVHLGLYGRFRRHSVPAPEPRGAVRARVLGREHAFDLNGPTACDVIEEAEMERIRSRLGQDPLRDDADPGAAIERIIRSRAAIGRLLLDQSVIAGVGNIFRAEALFVCGIHPEQPCNRLGPEQAESLWDTLASMLRIGVRYNRIITTDPEDVGKPRSRMTRDERLHVYKKDRCPRCSGVVSSWDCGARTVYACEACQRQA